MYLRVSVQLDLGFAFVRSFSWYSPKAIKGWKAKYELDEWEGLRCFARRSTGRERLGTRPSSIAPAAKAAARTSFRLHLHFYLFTRGFIIKMLFLNDVTSWFLGYSNLVGFQNVYYHGIKLAGAVWRWEDIKRQVFVKSPLLQNSLFRVVERMRTTVKGTAVKSALAKHTKLLVFTSKCANLWRSFRPRRSNSDFWRNADHKSN